MHNKPSVNYRATSIIKTISKATSDGEPHMPAISSAKLQCLDYGSQHFKSKPGCLCLEFNLLAGKSLSSDGQFDNSLTLALASRSGFFWLALTSGSRSERNLNQISPSNDFLFILGNLMGPVGDCMFRDVQIIHAWIGRLIPVDLQTLWGSLPGPIKFLAAHFMPWASREFFFWKIVFGILVTL